MSFKNSLKSSLQGLKQDVNRALDSARLATGRATTGSNSNSSDKIIQTPWQNQQVKTSFFQPISIDGSRWNKLFPYRLIVVRATEGGYKVESRGSGNVDLSIKSAPEGSTSILFENIGAKWEYRLPITPQQLSISNPFAITNTSTLKGIVEEHNGTKYKMINMAGSFGVWPNRSALEKKPTSGSSLSTLFAGTLQGISDVANQFGRLVRSATSNHPASKPNSLLPEASAAGFEGTGYAQALLLDQFLEQYSELKKLPQNSNLRLVLDIPKQNQSFLVTPINFTYSQSIESPNEIKFQLQLQAFKRVDLKAKFSETKPKSSPLTASTLQRALTSINQARRTVGSALNLVRAVRSDFQTPLNALRQSALFVKDLAGLTASAADLPRQIISDYQSAIKESIATLDQAASIATNFKLKSVVSSVKAKSQELEGVPQDSVASGQLGQANATALRTDPINNVFNSPEESFDLFDSIDVSALSLTPPQRARIDAEIELARSITVDDLRQNRQTILDLALQISNAFGAGDETFARIYGKPAPSARVQEMTVDEFSILRSLYDAAQALDVLTSTEELDDIRIQTAYDFVQDLANENGFTFNSASAKILVPVPFRLTIEEIALRYLGDADRWLEIVTLNALKEPYIDEDGFIRPLLSNADGRQFNISSAENLVVGQKIRITSASQPPTERRIINIEKISETNFLISVDGLDNLDVYTTADQAKIQAFLPGTVNSRDQIFIPSTEVAEDDVRTRPVKAAQGDPLAGLSRVDWLLTEDGDIAIDNYGDFKLAFGMNNLIQALKMKFAVLPGKLLKNPDFGAGIEPGTSTADLDLQQIFTQIRNTIQQDPRFSDIERLEIYLEGPVLNFNLVVTIAGNQGVLPLSFSVRL